MSSTQTRTDASTSSSSRKTNQARRTRYQSPPLYTIDRVTASNGVSTEVLTIEDTPPLPTPTSSSRSNSSYTQSVNSRQESIYDDQPNKKRKNNGSSNYQGGAGGGDRHDDDDGEDSISNGYRKDQGGSSSHASTSNNRNNNNNNSNSNGSTTVKGKRKLDAYQGYSTNGKESSSKSVSVSSNY